VLWVPELRRSVLSVLDIERKGYHVLFRDEQVLTMPKWSIFRLVVVLGLTIITLNCTTHAYLESGQFISLLYQNSAKQLFKNPLV
jgi:hypothetical protein